MTKPASPRIGHRRPIGRPTKCLALLVGLPLVLHLLLWLTPPGFSVWPAVVTTVLIGVVLSVAFHADARAAGAVAD